MSPKKKHWIKSEWGVGVGVAIFSFLLTIGYDYLKKVPVLNTIGNILKAIWSFILSFLNFDIRVWWLICFIIVVVIVFALIANLSNRKGLSPFLPKFFEYKSDTIKGYRFSWYWHKSNAGPWGLADFKIHCPKCDTPMKRTMFRNIYNCPRCDHTTPDEISCANAESVVIDNANRMLEKN